jgi:hypothetical protein
MDSTSVARIANGDVLNIRNAMDDPYDLVLGMFALAVTAVMLVAGELYLVTRPEQRRPKRRRPRW